MPKDTHRIIAILDAMEDGIMLVNRNLTIEHMNRAMIALFGDGVKQTCYQALNHRDNICPWCKAPEVFDQLSNLVGN